MKSFKFATFLKHSQPSEEDIANMSLDEYFNSIIDHKRFAERNYERIKEYYGEHITEGLITRFKLDPKKDYVLENLNTHDSDSLIKKLSQKFSEFQIDDCSDTRNDRRFIKLYIHNGNGVRASKLIGNDDLKSICDFYGYSISRTQEFINGVKISLEPIYSESANDKVYGECYGKIYHITTPDNAKKILSSGLRLRNGGDEPYRNFPKRIYFVAIPPSRNRIETRPEIEEAMMKYLPNERSGECVLLVDIYGTNINFYKDSVVEGESIYGEPNSAVYTYTNIPPKYIRLLYDSTEKI